MKIERAINLLTGQRVAYGDCMSKEEIEAFRMAIDALKKCWTGDVIPVVRCKDCVSYNNHFSQEGFGWCEEEAMRIVNDNFYCGNAVKKEEEVNDRDAD